MSLPKPYILRPRKGVEYHYAWRDKEGLGPKLRGEAGSLEYEASFRAALASRYAPIDNSAVTFRGLIRDYRMTDKYRNGLKPATHKIYERYLSVLDDEFGNVPLSALDTKEGRKRVIGMAETVHAEMAQTNRQGADYFLMVAGIVMNRAMKRGDIAMNPFAAVERVYKANRSDIIWTDADIEKLCREALPTISWAARLALATCQREADLVQMIFSKEPLRNQPYFDGELFHIKQAKGGARVQLPALSEIKPELKARWEAQGDGTHLLLNKWGRPWHDAGSFASQFSKEKMRLGFKEHHFHDLRGTSITRLALAGVDILRIAAVSGHSVKSVSNIIERYLGGRADLAKDAMSKLEAWLAEAKKVA